MLSSEVTRLARNCSDWYPLLDLCGYRDCLIADRDGVYDPGTANGRLLLGLKGTLSEVELHTIRARLTAGLLNKAARGELALILPVGLVREAGDLVVKNPDREVQARLDLIFATFLPGPLGQQGAARLQQARPEHPAPGPVRRDGLAPTHRFRHPAGAEEPGLCRRLRLRAHPLGPHSALSQGFSEEAPARAVEDRRRRTKPRLYQLGDVRDDRGHVAR